MSTISQVRGFEILDSRGKGRSHRYLADPEAIAAAMQQGARQGQTGR
jgi:hypothetical protein